MLRLLPRLLILLAALSAAPGYGQIEFVVHEPVPPLTLSDGRDLVAVADGRPIVVLFWASWCPYCKALMPHLQSVLDEYTPERVEVLAISFREDEPDDAQKMLDAQGYDFVTELDGDKLADSWGATATPRLYLIGPDGRLLYDMQANQSEPNRRYLTAPTSHAGKAARIAPHWAAQLRAAIDQYLVAQTGLGGTVSEGEPMPEAGSATGAVPAAEGESATEGEPAAEGVPATGSVPATEDPTTTNDEPATVGKPDTDRGTDSDSGTPAANDQTEASGP